MKGDVPMAKHPEWGSSADPRRWAEAFDERNQRIRPLSQSVSSVLGAMPEEVKKRVLINRRIQKVHEQFAAVVDPFILEHTNSVYLLKQKDPLQKNVSRENIPENSNPSPADKDGNSDSAAHSSSEQNFSQSIYDLVVYVDNSLCAAELNARRELIRLKYREQFNTIIDVFEIRISRGSYKEKYPFRESLEATQQIQPRELTPEDLSQIDEMTHALPEGKVKDSFMQAMKAQKRFSGDK